MRWLIGAAALLLAGQAQAALACVVSEELNACIEYPPGDPADAETNVVVPEDQDERQAPWVPLSAQMAIAEKVRADEARRAEQEAARNPPNEAADAKAWADRARTAVAAWKACLTDAAVRFAKTSKEEAGTVADAARGRCAATEGGVRAVMSEMNIESDERMDLYWSRLRPGLLAQVLDARAR